MKSTSAILFLLSVIGQNAASAASLKTFPLVPHHVQRMRRLEEGRNLSAEPTRPENGSSEQHGIRRRAIAQQIGALYQGYGTHYVDLWCGSPPQRQTVIVDTGSGVTAFPCSGCSQCGVPDYHVDQLFVEDNSATFQTNTCSGIEKCKTSRGSCRGGKCTISMSYAEGSRWDAYEATDKCYIGGPHETPLVSAGTPGGADIDPNHASALAFDLAFGCQTLVTGLFKTQLADGIMGMDNRDDAFWGQMFAAQKMGNDKQFSLCFARQPTAEREGTESGAVTLGGADPRLHTTDMVYSSGANQGRSGFFSVKLRNIYLRDGNGGESVRSDMPDKLDGVVKIDVSEGVLNQGGVIVDSGTTDTYWNKQLARAFGPIFTQLSGKTHSNNPMSLTPAELAALPTILFQIQADPAENADKDADNTPGLAGSLDPEHPTDVIVALPPSHYMEYDSDTGKYTSRFYMTENGGSVLGANTMMGHDVLFDADKNRIGWAESDCDYTSLVTSNGYDFAITGQLQEAGSGGTIDTNTNTLPGGVITPVVTTPPVAAPTFAAPTFAAPTFAQGPAPTEPPVPAPTEPPVPAPTEPPVAAPIPLDTTTTILTTEPPVVAAAPVEAPTTEVQEQVQPPVAAPVAPTPTAPPCDGDDCPEQSKFQEILDKAWNFILDVYAFVKEAVEKFLEVCDTPECRYPVGIGLSISLVAGCCFSYCCSCLFYCLCCRCCRKKPKTGPKYQTLAGGGDDDDDDDDDELEMVNGKSFSTYKDDPLENGNGRSNGNGKGSPMKMRMKETKKKPSSSKPKKPEFQGDFI